MTTIRIVLVPVPNVPGSRVNGHEPGTFGTGTFFLLLMLVFSSAPASAEEPQFPRAEVPAKKIFVGERLAYSVRYLGLPVGRGEAEVREIVLLRGRRAYHIVVHARSQAVLNLIYKVNDEYHTYIDTEKLTALRYKKNLNEGSRHVRVVMDYAQKSHRVYYYFPGGKNARLDTVPDVQDELSCGYWFRTQPYHPGEAVTIPVHTDRRDWDLAVSTRGENLMRVPGIGRFHAMEVFPEIDFQGIFVKKGKITGWISLDERRIPLKMSVKIPILGSVTAVLESYEAGRNVS